MIPNRIPYFLKNCATTSHVHQIQAQLFLQNLRSNPTVAPVFISTCLTFGLLKNAYFSLSHLKKPNVFSCNSVIRAYSHSQIPHIPCSIYKHMLQNSILPNNYTFTFLFKSLADFRELKLAQMVHSHVVKLGHLNNIYAQNSLLSVYASCSRMGLTRQVFDEMPERDVVSWTVLIKGYRSSRQYDDALITFEQMQYAGVVPNRVTMVNALAACGSFGAIEMGVWIHDFVRKKGWELDVILGTALVDMYGKCGRIDEGLSVFDSMKEKNVYTWNAVINGLALAKSGDKAVWWFDRMEQEGFKPDDVTLVEVLCVCSHSGLVDKGWEIFTSLLEGKYGFSPLAKHYACMIDLLGRAGCLEDAFRLIKSMPFEPTKSIWGSFLSSCRTRGNLELTEYAAKKLLELEPENSSYNDALSNLYAEMNRWDDVEKIRGLMKERGLVKDLGSSSLEHEPKESLGGY